MSGNYTAVRSRVLAIPTVDPQVATEYFQRMRLSCETDSFDVHHDVTAEVGGFVLVDARKAAAAYRQERLPGARTLPHEEITGADLAALDRAPVYITYGRGPASNAGTRAAPKLAIGGLEYWKRADYSTEQGCGCRKPHP
jgi:rhodanese-related sulfurtransferase